MVDRHAGFRILFFTLLVALALESATEAALIEMVFGFGRAAGAV